MPRAFEKQKQEIDTAQPSINWATDCLLETDLDIGFPMDYIENVSERIALYRELDTLRNEDELQHYAQRLEDRFGKPTPQVEELFNTIRLRWLCCKLGIEKIFLKKEHLTIYFTTSSENYWHSEEFGHIIKYMFSKPKRCQLKEEKPKNPDAKPLRYGIIADVRTVAGATNLLTKIAQGDFGNMQ